MIVILSDSFDSNCRNLDAQPRHQECSAMSTSTGICEIVKQRRQRGRCHGVEDTIWSLLSGIEWKTCVMCGAFSKTIQSCQLCRRRVGVFCKETRCLIWVEKEKDAIMGHNYFCLECFGDVVCAGLPEEIWRRVGQFLSWSQIKEGNVWR